MNHNTLAMMLTPAQMAQQAELSMRMLHMASLGTPKVDSENPNMPQLLTLHALITAEQLKKRGVDLILADLGTDQKGFAPNPIDNVGVQYGLGALVQGDRKSVV